ncbi:MAG: nitronate monooxygenase [Dehalococcoidia bacterium]
MLATRFTGLVGCDIPFQQAPMGAVTTPALVAAVANAGGVGMLPLQAMPPQIVSATLDDIAQRTSGVFGVTFLMPFFDRDCLDVAVQKARIIDFYYGDPDPALIDVVHSGGAIASWQVGSVREGRAAADAGCDFIIVQGIEAGGRVRGQVALFPLLTGVLDEVDVPVVAAGGLGSPRSVAAAFAAGADAVRIGTRLNASEESAAHPAYKQALINAEPQDTVLTDEFSVMWPNGPEPHRVLRSSLEAARAFQGDTVGQMQIGPETLEVPRLSVVCPNTHTTGEVEAMALYAGQSVGAVRQVQPATEIIDELMSGAERLLSVHHQKAPAA